jgi:hypothetical protein
MQFYKTKIWIKLFIETNVSVHFFLFIKKLFSFENLKNYVGDLLSNFFYFFFS